MPGTALKTNDSRKTLYFDIAAAVMLAGFAAFYIYKSFFSIQLVDETFFLSIPHRLLMGDRLILDEWHLSQFTSVLQLLPMKLFYLLNGSSEGIVPAARLAFTAFQIGVSAAVYAHTRKYGAASLISLFFFCSFVPITIMALNYYTLPAAFFELIGLMLFCSGKEPGVPRLLLCGALMAGTVLAEPITALVYFAYTAAVLIVFLAEKKGKALSGSFGYILRIRSWGFITAGVAVCAAVFLVFLLSRSDAASIIKAVPDLLGDTEHTSGSMLAENKVLHILSVYKLWEGIAAAIILVLAAVFRKTGRSCAVPVIAASALALVICIDGLFFSPNVFFSYYAFYFQRFMPLLFLAVVCVIAEKTISVKLTAFFVFTALITLARDVSSNISFGFSAAAAIVPAVLIVYSTLRSVFSRTFTDKGKKAVSSVKALFSSRLIPKKKKAAVSVLCLLLCGILAVQTVGFIKFSGVKYVKENVFFTQKTDELDTTLTRGPMKGIKTTARAAHIYDSMLSDMDAASEECGGPVYVAGLACWLYLYAERPYSAYSAWFVDEDYQTRQPAWWASHPDKRPECIYIPIYHHDTFAEDRQEADNKLAFFKTICSGDIRESETGYTIFIKEWNI